MDKKKTVRKYFSKFLENGKNGRWQMTNKAEDTIIEGRKLAPQNTKGTQDLKATQMLKGKGQTYS